MSRIEVWYLLKFDADTAVKVSMSILAAMESLGDPGEV